MSDFELKRKDDLDNLSKVPIILVKLDNLCDRLNSLEARFSAELEKVSLRLEKIESLRERLAEVEVIVNNDHSTIKEIQDRQIKQNQDTINFLKRLSVEFFLVVIGFIFNIILTLLKK